MRVADIPAIHRIEHASFPMPWPDHAFRQELQSNRMAHYLVAWAGDEVVGYAGVWYMVDEAHITTFAVAPSTRRRGVGSRLMVAILRLAVELGASVATLEVRLSNLPARRLYGRFGFKPVGIRPRYYSDNGEDALILTTDRVSSREMIERVDRVEAALRAPGPVTAATSDHAAKAP